MPTLDPFNLSDSEFDAVMTEIDHELRQRSDRVPGRELRGIALFVRRFKVQIDNRHPLTRRIIGWFSHMYGARLGIDLDFGQTVALVNGEICKMRGARFFGNMLLVCSPVAIDVSLKAQTPIGTIPVTNLLAGKIEGVTLELASRLSQTECDSILKAYKRMFLAFAGLEASLGNRYGSTDAPYITEAMHDLRSSSQSMIGSRPNYGQAKWDSLQAVEKVVKSCIVEKGATPPRSHDVADLCRMAVRTGVPAVDPALIAFVQCPAAVRYTSTIVGKAEAIEAHYAAMTVCGELAPVIKKTAAEILCHEFRHPYRNGAMLDCLMIGYGAPVHPQPTAPVASIRTA